VKVSDVWPLLSDHFAQLAIGTPRPSGLQANAEARGRASLLKIVIAANERGHICARILEEPSLILEDGILAAGCGRPVIVMTQKNAQSPGTHACRTIKRTQGGGY